MVLIAAIFAFLAFSSAALAEEALPGMNLKLNEIDRRLERGLNWGGSLEVEDNIYKDKAYNGRMRQEALVRAHLKPTITQEKFEVYSDIFARADAENVDRNGLRFNEGYVLLNASNSFRLKAGKIIYSWGSAQFYNPTDVINPVDYYDAFYPEKLGVMAIDFTIKPFSGFSFQAGLLPVFEPSVVENAKSRWIDYSRIFREAVLAKASYPSNVVTASDVDFSVKRNIGTRPQFFARSTANLMNFDVSLMYVYRYNHVPSDLLLYSSTTYDFINNRPLVEVEALPYYRQEHLVGADVSFPFFGTVMFFEGTYSAPISHVSGVSSLEQIQNLNRLGLGTNLTSQDIENKSQISPMSVATGGLRKDWSKVHVALQYARAFFFGPNRPGELFQAVVKAAAPSLANEVSPADFYKFTSGAILSGASIDFSNRVSWSLGGIINTQQTGYLAHTKVEYKWREDFKLALGLEYLNGKSGSIFHYFNRNSKLSLGLSVFF